MFLALVVGQEGVMHMLDMITQFHVTNRVLFAVGIGMALIGLTGILGWLITKGKGRLPFAWSLAAIVGALLDPLLAFFVLPLPPSPRETDGFGGYSRSSMQRYVILLAYLLLVVASIVVIRQAVAAKN